VVRQLLDRGEAARLGGRNEKLTILFSDLENFATVSEAMPPEALVQHIAPYFEAMLDELQQARATVDKFIGDSIMAFWGAPLDDPDHHARAMGAIWQCRQAVEVLNARWKNRGALELRTRFGLAYGNAVVGNVGTSQRLNYTALGDTVNLASRLENLNKYYGTQILAAEPIPELTGEGFIFRRVDVVAVKGRSGEVAIYELLGPVGEVTEAALRFKTDYESAWDAYARRDFALAQAILAGIASPWCEGVSVERLRTLVAWFVQNPPPEDWRAVSVFDIK
jgi:adenylate cyclase